MTDRHLGYANAETHATVMHLSADKQLTGLAVDAVKVAQAVGGDSGVALRVLVTELLHGDYDWHPEIVAMRAAVGSLHRVVWSEVAEVFA